MPNPPDRVRPPGPGGPRPIEPGSALHRLVEMVAEAVARSSPRSLPATPDRSEGQLPLPEAPTGGRGPAPGPAARP
jgi:hypothetical protein